MKNFILLLLVLLGLSLNAISQNGSDTPVLGFTITDSNKCNCNPLINKDSCVYPTVILNLASSACDECAGACYEVVICNNKGSCTYIWPGTSSSVQHINITSQISWLIGDNYFSENCFTITEYISFECGIPADSSNGQSVKHSFCLEPNPLIDLPHTMCVGQEPFCNDVSEHYYYNWSNCGVPNGWTLDSCFNTPAAPCTYNVLVKDTTTKCYSSWNITVYPYDTVGVSITDDWHNHCSLPDTIKFTAHPTNGGSTPLYQWWLNTGGIPYFVGTNSSTYKLPNPQNNDKVYCDMTAPKKICQSNNPAKSNTITVIGTTPEITDTTGLIVACEGTNVSFTVTVNASRGTPPLSYVWYYNDNFSTTYTASNSSFNPLIIDSVTPANSGTYTCLVYDQNFCWTLKDIDSLTVKPSPVITHQPASKAVCLGNTAEFTITGSGYGLSYQWYKQQVPDHLISGATNSSYSIIPNIASDAGHYFCVITNAPAGCEVTSNKVILTVLPKPTVSISPPSPVLCTTSSVPLTARGASTYTWLYATSLGSITDSTVIASPAVTTTYTVIGTNLSGCKDTAKVTVTYSRPPVSISPNPATICSGKTDTLTASGANTYLWSPSTGLSSTTHDTVKASPTVTTTYTVTGTDTNLCTNTANVTVIIGSPPSPGNLYITQPQQEGDTVTYSLSVEGTPPFKYQWMKSEVNIPGATNSNFTINNIACGDTGIYSCKIKNLCDSVVTKVVNLYVLGCIRYEHSISGLVRYDNTDSTRMTNTTVYLINDSNVIIDS